MDSVTQPTKPAYSARLLAHLNAMPVEERDRFAERCGTTVGYLRKAISKGDALGEALSVRLETHTQDLVTLRELRPEFAAALDAAGYVRTNSTMRAYLRKGMAQI